MENKIYKVIKSDLYIDGGIQSTETKIFMDKQLALTYLQKLISASKQDKDEDELEDYCVEETETSYERYLEGRSFEDSVSIWLEEDTICMDLDFDKNKDTEYEHDI